LARSIRRLRGINRHKEAKDLFVNHKNYGMTPFLVLKQCEADGQGKLDIISVERGERQRL
jgi:hypothetical protein